MSRTLFHQCKDIFNRSDTSSSSNCRTVESRGSACKVKLLAELPSLQKTEDEAGMKDIAGTGRVHLQAPGKLPRNKSLFRRRRLHRRDRALQQPIGSHIANT